MRFLVMQRYPLDVRRLPTGERLLVFKQHVRDNYTRWKPQTRSEWGIQRYNENIGSFIVVRGNKPA